MKRKLIDKYERLGDSNEQCVYSPINPISPNGKLMPRLERRLIMKKILSIFLSLVFVCLFSVSGYAISVTDYSRYEEYIGYVEAGEWPESIPYSTWYEIVTKNDRLMEEMFESSESTTSRNIPPIDFSYMTIQTGDVLITNDIYTAMAGIVGHVGIAYDSNLIIHIADANSVPSFITKSKWAEKYANGTTRLYRMSNSTYAALAANEAYTKYINVTPKATYDILTRLDTYDKTYCSKIVWQAYHYISPSCANLPIIDGYGGHVSPGDIPNKIPLLTYYNSYGI